MRVGHVAYLLPGACTEYLVLLHVYWKKRQSVILSGHSLHVQVVHITINESRITVYRSN